MNINSNKIKWVRILEVIAQAILATLTALGVSFGVSLF